MDIKTKLEKLRSLEDKDKKLILWIIVVVLGLIMIFFWFKISVNRLNNINQNGEVIKLPEIKLPDTKLLETAEEVTLEDVANWQTYQSKDYGFEVKFPKNFKIEQGGTVIQNFNFTDNSGANYEAISVWPEKETDLQKLADNFYKKEFVDKIDLFDFNGQVAARIQAKQGANVGSTVIMLKNGFGFELPDVMNDTLSIDLKNILSTFRFIN